ncbi:MAG: hypothetical protein U1C97_00130, partial [Candidatus Gracilibacteria bacterium]|nr:hypothetical protein [Candidatus Gracilibacteria bacterium]
PMAMLMLFIVSASITGSLVLGKPLLLAMKGKTKEGLILLLTTVLFLAIITALVFVGISRIA